MDISCTNCKKSFLLTISVNFLSLDNLLYWFAPTFANQPNTHRFFSRLRRSVGSVFHRQLRCQGAERCWAPRQGRGGRQHVSPLRSTPKCSHSGTAQWGCMCDLLGPLSVSCLAMKTGAFCRCLGIEAVYTEHMIACVRNYSSLKSILGYKDVLSLRNQASWENVMVWVLNDKSTLSQGHEDGGLEAVVVRVNRMCASKIRISGKRNEASANRRRRRKTKLLVFIIMLPALVLIRSDTLVLGPWIKIFYYLSICV